MKTLFITDKSVNLSSTLISQQNIYLINTDKSPIGQITYTIDYLVSAGFEIIYLTSDEGFSFINDICQKIIDVHSNGKINVINLDSGSIGKNNLALRLTLSKNISETLIKYEALSNKIINESYLKILDLHNVSLI